MRLSGGVPVRLTVTWSASCSVGALDYALYEGVLGGSFDTHVAKDCSDDGGDLEESFRPGFASRYYLVVPLTADQEGSYGTSSVAIERPRAAPGARCRPGRLPGECPP